MEEISKLAEILRGNGIKILNNESKLTLSCDLLNKLNSSVNLILEQRDVMSSFHVINNTNIKPEVFSDLQFLYDFVGKSTSLKIIPSVAGQLCKELVDISKFKQLQLFEVFKVNIKLILGIEKLRKKLQFLVCVRCINALKDILIECGADASENSVWNELKEASFAHNNLCNIDESIDYTPWLNTLDLSHNNIQDADILCSLANLRYLNLGYNKLNKVPSFSGQICSRLKVLVLRNNFIEDIQEVQNLINLCEFDLVENCLIEHSLLAPLSYLATLEMLNLKGNPLSYHPQHRTNTANYLHMNTITVKFLLDEIILNKTEQQCIGSLYPKHLHKRTESQNTEVSESTSVPSLSRRIRHASISDDNIPPHLDSNSVPVQFTSPENLDTKADYSNLTSYKNYIKFLYNTGSVADETHTSLPTSSTPYEKETLYHSTEVTVHNNETSEVTSGHTTFVTASNSLEKSQETNDYIFKSEESIEPSDDEELESGESNIFLATRKGNSDGIIVILTQTHLTEKDPVTMKGLGRFSLESIMICDKIVEDNIPYIYLEFDTLRSDRCRYYTLEEKEGQRFYERLKDIVDNRPPEENLFTLYRCMKCSSHFAIEKQKTMHKQEVTCINCKSKFVFENDQ